MEETIAYFGLKDEDDYMYKKAEAKAQKRFEQNQRFTVISLLDIPSLTEAQIIVAVGVSAEMIHHIKKDLAAAPKKIARLKEKLSTQQIAEQLNLPLTWVEKHITQA